MRIVAGRLVHELRHLDRLAAGDRRRGEQLFHPGVVVRAVEDDDRRAGDRSRRRCAHLEEMRVLIGVAENADHGHLGAAELLGDIAIEILRCDNAQRRRLGRSKAERQGKQDRGDRAHRGRSGRLFSLCYIVAERLRQSQPPGSAAAR
jgi:hypothetical protein